MCSANAYTRLYMIHSAICSAGSSKRPRLTHRRYRLRFAQAHWRGAHHTETQIFAIRGNYHRSTPPGLRTQRERGHSAGSGRPCAPPCGHARAGGGGRCALVLPSTEARLLPPGLGLPTGNAGRHRREARQGAAHGALHRHALPPGGVDTHRRLRGHRSHRRNRLLRNQTGGLSVPLCCSGRIRDDHVLCTRRPLHPAVSHVGRSHGSASHRCFVPEDTPIASVACGGAIRGPLYQRYESPRCISP